MNTHIKELLSLDGLCAVVIGGKGKVGYPMAEALAEAGARVYIASPSATDEDKAIKDLKEKGLNVFGKALNQSDESDIESLVSSIESDYKTPDILINSGVERPMKKFVNDDSAAWDRSMEVNARGLFLTCRTFGRRMAIIGGGSIINIASIYGLVAPDQSIYEGTDMNTEPDYSYTKGGMIMFSKYLASYFAQHDVRVNCIAPGGMFNNQDESFIEKYIQKVPMRRMAYPDDMKGIAVFLASSASKYITGAVIPVDGGLTII
ncbi:MAG: SDR family oxidoreductase [Bacteroidetes bacterium]|nr:SDR family oxidoreductase [Bacteroidota bacterium]